MENSYYYNGRITQVYFVDNQYERERMKQQALQHQAREIESRLKKDLSRYIIQSAETKQCSLKRSYSQMLNKVCCKRPQLKIGGFYY